MDLGGISDIFNTCEVSNMSRALSGGMIYICTVQAYNWQERRSMRVARGVHHRIAQLCGLWLIDQCGHYDRIVFVT